MQATTTDILLVSKLWKVEILQRRMV